MPQPQVSEEKLSDLAEIYGWLKQDASDMLYDLLQGVSLWRSTSRMLFGFAVLTFLLVPLFTWGSISSGGASGAGLSAGLGLIAIFMLGLGVATTLTGIRYRDRYIVLRTKYSNLYVASKKLS